MLTEEQINLLKDKLERCQHRIHEIELTNDKKYRLEWRELKLFEKWAQHEIRKYFLLSL